MDNELLQAISKMMDEKLEPINTRLDDLEISNKGIREAISKVNHKLEPKINAVYEGA